MPNSEVMVPFQLDHQGRIASVSDDDARIRQHFLSLINTEPGERTVVANYGIPISALLFENTDLVQQTLYTDIADSASYWEPGISVGQGIPVGQQESDSLVLLNLTYARNDSEVSGGVPSQTNTVVVGPGGVLTTITRG